MTLGAVAIEAIAELRRAFKYSEDQPRDELGRFGEGGGGGGGSFNGVSTESWDEWALSSYAVDAALKGELEVGGHDVDGTTLSSEAVAKYETAAKTIDAAANSHAVPPGTVLYRGVSFDSEAEAIAAFKYGNKITSTGFTATSLERWLAEDYAYSFAEPGESGRFPVMLRYQGSNGALGVQAAPYGEPSPEVVMPKGVTFRVARVGREGDMLVVDMYSTAKLPKGVKVGVSSHWTLQKAKPSTDRRLPSRTLQLFEDEVVQDDSPIEGLEDFVDPDDRVRKEPHAKSLKYSEDQPRDELGRFGEGGGGGGATGGAGRVGRGGVSPTADSARAGLPVAVSLCEGLPIDPNISHVFGSTDSFQELETSIRYIDEHALKHNVMADTGEMLIEMGVSTSRCMDLAGEFGARKYGDNAQEQAASAVTAKWANTSGDSSPAAIATQLAAASEFADELGEDPSVDHFPGIPLSESAKVLGHGREGTLRAVLRAQYENTQRDLREQGIEDLVLYRGIGNTHGTVGPVADLDVELQPLSSFSLIPREALRFASREDSGGIIAVRVPRERVFSTFRTGLGCVGEAEVVILGGKVSGRGFGWSRVADHPLRSAPLGENNSNTTVARNLWGATDIR